jgi:hypothetical protein
MHLHPIYEPDRIPPMIRQTLDDYGKRGLPPGDCLRAVLCGDLFLAFARADDETSTAMPAIIVYITERLPAGSFGNYALVADWIAARKAERQAIGPGGRR